jgi:hypothetical protein
VTQRMSVQMKAKEQSREEKKKKKIAYTTDSR